MCKQVVCCACYTRVINISPNTLHEFRIDSSIFLGGWGNTFFAVLATVLDGYLAAIVQFVFAVEVIPQSYISCFIVQIQCTLGVEALECD